MGLLTASQTAEYRDNGFVVVPAVFTELELHRLREASTAVLAHCGPLVPQNPRIQVEPETESWAVPVVRKIEPVIDESPVFMELANDPKMMSAAADILGEPVLLFEDKLNFKPPRIGSSYPLHQDRSYWMELAPGIPATDRLVTISVLLDDATIENGCLRLVPGDASSDLCHQALA